MQENKSQSAIKIIERLKKSLKIKTDIELSEFLNIRPNTISTWKKRDSVDFNSIISICELYELDLNEIFLDKKMESMNSGETVLVSREVQFQYSKENDNSELVEVLPKFNFPFVVSENSRAFQVTSNNMFPVIEENTFVICEKTDVKNIEEDAVVVLISKEKGLFINRINKSKNNPDVYLLSSENEFYSNVKINFSDIKEIWTVCGILSYDFNKQNKFKFINDSLKEINKFIEKANSK